MISAITGLYNAAPTYHKPIPRAPLLQAESRATLATNLAAKHSMAMARLEHAAEATRKADLVLRAYCRLCPTWLNWLLKPPQERLKPPRLGRNLPNIDQPRQIIAKKTPPKSIGVGPNIDRRAPIL